MSDTATSDTFPKVRVVVLNYDGGQMTLDCLDSLLATEWPADALEIIMVDNGSLDAVAAIVSTDERYQRIRVLEPLANLGFAGGCNLGISQPGDHHYVALINNDATVAPGWLQAMVSAIDHEDDLGAASAKMLFADRAHLVEVEVADAARISAGDPRVLGVRVVAARLDGEPCDDRLAFDEGFFMAEGPERHLGEEMARWSGPKGMIRVAAGTPPPQRLALRLSSPSPRTVRLSTGAEERTIDVGVDPVWVEISLDASTYDIINNVGSELYQRGFAGDRGFQQIDIGQFDTPAEVFAWCGGAALLKRTYLDDVGLFDDDFFIYYEDSDLSWRGRLRGWRYVYVPDAVVRHHHAASTGVGSDTFLFHTERNRVLMTTKNAPALMAWRTALGLSRRILIDLVRYVLLPPVTLRMPRTVEVRRHLRVLRSYLQLLPTMLRRRFDIKPTIKRASVMVWEVDKWAQ
jgi:GT2 family glycosyltransferase